MTDNPNADLVAALGALANINKTGDVQAGQRRYRYVELDELLDAARPILAKHRLALTQDIATDDTGHLAVTTILWHASGERFTFGPLRSAQPEAPQALGSIITYWRRYSAMAALGVAGADDDGQAAKPVVRHTGRADQPDQVDRQYQTPPPPPAAMRAQPGDYDGHPTGEQAATQKQQAALHAKLNGLGVARDAQKRYLLNLLGAKRGIEFDDAYHLTRADASLLFDELELIRLGKPE